MFVNCTGYCNTILGAWRSEMLAVLFYVFLGAGQVDFGADKWFWPSDKWIF